MALHDNPPHLCTSYTVASGTDLGGGVSLTYTSAQADIPCSINTASSSERELFAQQGQVVSHTVAFLTSALTTALTRGMKLVTSDGTNLHVHGLSAGRAYGSIPAFTYAHCESQN